MDFRQRAPHEQMHAICKRLSIASKCTRVDGLGKIKNKNGNG
jgi:hypothetical protein